MNVIEKIIRLSMISAFLLPVSCDVKVADSVYPAQTIYLPAAVQADHIYLIDQVEGDAGSVPGDGNPYKAVIDYDCSSFMIPLAVYRSGIGNEGDVKVDISLDDEIVDDMFIDGRLDPDEVRILPYDLKECEEKVVVRDGCSNAVFNVSVDLDWLMDRAQKNRIFVFGVSVSSKDREVSEDYGRAVIMIDTALFYSI